MKRQLFVLLWSLFFMLIFNAQADAAVKIREIAANSKSETRINTAGQLDPNFGSGGIVTTDFGTNSDGGRGVAVQSDGKIVVAGYAYLGDNGDMSLIRYLAETFLGENAVYLPLLLRG